MAAIKFIKRTVALDGSSVSELLPASFFNSESSAHTFIIVGQRDGAAVDFTGYVSATFHNANDADVLLRGYIADGAAVVTLSNTCYVLSGPFTLTIDVNGAAVYECNSYIKRRSSSIAYDPNDELTVAALGAEIDAMQETVSAEIDAMQETVSAEIATMQAATIQAQIATNAANAVANDIITGQPLNLNWVVGNINSTDGTNKSGYTTRLRINEYIYSEIGMGAVIPEGMKAYWYKYSGNSAATFIESADGWQTGSFTIPGGYYYRFVVAYTGDGEIDKSAGSAVVVSDYQYTDKTLTAQGKAADAAAVGKALTAIANTFNTSTDYSIGQYVWYSGTLYRFTREHAAGSWNSSHVQEIVLSGETFKYIRSLDNTNDVNTTIQPGMYRWTAGSRIPQNTPTTKTARMMVFGPNNSNIYDKSQLVIDVDGDMYSRSGDGDSPGTWGEWVHYTVDKTLSQSGVAADAKVTGRIFDSYNERIVPLEEKAEQTTGTSSGITYTWSGNTISMSGTATGTIFALRLFYYSSSSAHNIPWIKKGNIYHLKLSRTANDGARIRIRTYIGETLIDYFRFSSDAVFTLQRADELTYIEIAAYAVKGDAVNNTLTYEMLMSPSLQYLAGKTVNSPLKLRVMQNNIGVFRFGRLPGSGNYTRYEHTAAEAAQKLQNYKKFYSDYRPDILCLQEFYRYLGPNDTVNVNTNLYDQIFAYHEDENSSSKQRAIFSNLPCVLDGLKTVTYGDSSLTFMEMTILANNIHVFTTALNPSSGDAAVTTRQNQLEALLTYADQYNNVIMCLDLNAYSESEHTSMLSTVAQHGFDSTFGGSYWGRHNTYINPPGQSTPMSYYRKIDAIWCKGAMKMVNARTLFDETTHYPDTYVIDPTEVTEEKPNVMAANLYNDLASDHVPIFADIVVYG